MGKRKRKKILAILPESIGGRLTMSSIIAGFEQNDCNVTVYDELFDKNLEKVLKKQYDYIAGYDFSGLKIKVDNHLDLPSINYFSDDIRSNTSGKYWEEYLPYLNDDGNYTLYWDRQLTEYESIKNICYLPHFVNFEVYKDLRVKPEFDIMFAGRLDTNYRLSMFEELVMKMPDLKVAWYAIDRHYKDARERAQYPEILDLCYMGFIDNEPDMARAINNTKIVFNMHSQGITSLNYRTFQTVACKRLMISDYRDELALFDGYMPYYEDMTDLLFKVENYLDDEVAYKTVTKNCYRIAKQSHNSQDCVRYMLSMLK